MKTAEASTTAKVIAASTILLACDARTVSLVAPEAATLCEHFLSGRFTDRLLARSAALPLTRALWCGIERATLPGIMAHYWHRKNWIEARCRRAIASGAGRVIVLGAGFDTLGLRLACEMQNLDVYELDHPATQSVKATALTALSPLKNFHLAPCNMAEEPLPHMAEEPLPIWLFDAQTPTVVIIEGVLMYLPEDKVKKLFASLRQLAGGHVQIIFSFMTQWPDGSSGFRPRSLLVERWQSWRGEPFTWAIAPGAMEKFLSALGFALREMVSAREFSRTDSRLEGENLVVCEPIEDTR